MLTLGLQGPKRLSHTYVMKLIQSQSYLRLFHTFSMLLDEERYMISFELQMKDTIAYY